MTQLLRRINEKNIISAINVEKDVDGFHPLNVAGLWQKQEYIIPCTPKGIIRMLKSTEMSIEGKHAVILGRSNIVGLPISKLLLDENATVTIAHSKTKNLKEITKQADILIAAIGKAKFVTEDMVKEYHNYWFHIKGFFIGESLALIICSLAGLIIHFFL